jgi:hypothetical protein
MVDLGKALGQGSLQGGQGQLLAQATGQVPPSDTLGKHIQQHRQVDKLPMQPEVGDISNPYLIGSYYLQPLNQIGIPGEGVIAVGRSLTLPISLSLEPQLPHDRLTRLLLIRQPSRLNWTVMRR